MNHIAITPGEPAGIGPDIVIQLAQQDLPAALTVIADAKLLASRAAALNIPLRITSPTTGPQPAHRAGELTVMHVSTQHEVRVGQGEKCHAGYILNTLDIAIEGCRQKRFDAMVTGPVNKSLIHTNETPFRGHTDYLAQQSQTRDVVMMLATEGLRVALATTHIPLTQVSQALTPKRLETTLRILHLALQTSHGIANPTIAVCGLNPHAGEAGQLGHEEIDTIEPVLQSLRQQGMTLLGPLPADTAFIPKYLDQADAFLAMYHDQGLPVLKYKSFGNAVNVTLGLPFIRTSVDHGTAFELAGTGQANPASLHYAVNYALELIQTRNGHV
jgi:4-hydroxythreonine-4-phosphate dehydrogenase